MDRALDRVKAVVFDVFGTLVDWRTSVTRELASFGRSRGITHDWQAFADEWRGLYQPSMEEVRAGRRSFVILDELHVESLRTLIDRHDLPIVSNADIDHLKRVWHRLEPWPDVVEGLYRLKRRHLIAPLSNGNIGLMVRLAKHGGLPWDAILGAEVAQAYKPDPRAYIGAVEALNLEPAECLMVAAHNDDLVAAEAQGLRTAFVVRPTEHGAGQTKDLTASQPWTIVTDTIGGVADALACPR
ncbi:MAG: haloacid dehalogenase type II [Pseudomonadota bacterium]